jgi:hypothetical protein
MKVVTQNLPLQTALDFGIVFVAMNLPKRNDSRKRDRDDGDGDKEQDGLILPWTSVADNTVMIREYDDDEEEDQDDDFQDDPEEREADIAMGQTLVKAIKGLMESNKRLKTANSTLKKGIERVNSGFMGLRAVPPSSSLA